MCIIGIDLGTTNSLVVTYKDGKEQLIPNSFGQYCTPSIVSIDNEQIYVGKIAKERLITHPDTTYKLFKRQMGTDIKYGPFSPTDLSSFLVLQLIEDAKNYLQEEIEEIIISVPAYFNAFARQATKDIQNKCGIPIHRLINEPSAAALYCHQNDDFETFVVFDFGGGTLDVSIVDCFENVISIVSIAGNNVLGGCDIDLIIAQYFCQKNQISFSLLSKENKETLLRISEKTKIILSDQRESTMCMYIQNQKMECKINQDILYDICQPVFSACKQVIGKAVKESGYQAKDLDAMILVGGSSKMKVLHTYLEETMNIPIRKMDKNEEFVALGLAKYIGIKQREDSVKDLVLTDICPFSLCTSIINRNNVQIDLSKVIIPKNSVLPTSKTVYLQTSYVGQDHVDIHVYQGEAMYAKDNLLLGCVKIDVPVNQKDFEQFQLTYTYDINSMLYLDFYICSTKEHKYYVVDNNQCIQSIDNQKEMKNIIETSYSLHKNNEYDYMQSRIQRMFQEENEAIQKYLYQLSIDFENTFNNCQTLKQKNELLNQVVKILDEIEYQQDIENLDIFSKEEETIWN
ncbi:Hsp70 family protein [Floccifex sp.]|uniref:Hsp70 family protein n=1 Tax=Floccifex sp. TaxID=2815810 RepID=UPI003EFDBDDA